MAIATVVPAAHRKQGPGGVSDAVLPVLAGLGTRSAPPAIATAVPAAPRSATGDTPRRDYDPSGDGDVPGDGGDGGDQPGGSSPRSASDSDDAETMHRCAFRVWY